MISKFRKKSYMAIIQEMLDNSAHHHVHIPDRKILTFIGVLSAMFLSALDQTIVGTAMPRIVSELHGFDRYTWVTTVYLLTSTAMVPVVGKLSEQLGRKRIFLTGIIMFLLGSALSGFAGRADPLFGISGMNQLIIFRGLQGIGGGVLTGTAFAIIADLFSPAERGKYTGMMAGIFGVASVVGPLVGGYLTDNVGWRWVFYVNIPIGIVVLLALFFTFPSLKRHGISNKIDYVGAFGIASAAALLTLGASLAGANGWAFPWVWVCIAIGMIVGSATIIYETKIPEAVIPPQLFKNSIFSLSMIVTFLSGVGMFGAIIYLPLFLQGVVGVGATNSGLLLLPLMAGLVAGSIGGGFLVSHTGKYKIQASAGFLLMTFGMFLLGQLKVSSPESQVAFDMIFVGLGLGISMPVFNVISQNAVSRKFVSSATSTIQFTRQIGGSLGLAVFGSIVNQQFENNLKHNIPLQTYASLPPKLQSTFNNPQSLFGNNLQNVVSGIHDPKILSIIHIVVEAIKLSLAQSLTSIFTLGMFVMIFGFFITLFIKEIPLQRAGAWRDE